MKTQVEKDEEEAAEKEAKREKADAAAAKKAAATRKEVEDRIAENQETLDKLSAKTVDKRTEKDLASEKEANERLAADRAELARMSGEPVVEPVSGIRVALTGPETMQKNKTHTFEATVTPAPAAPVAVAKNPQEIVRVDFSVNGIHVATRTEAPYTYDYNPEGHPGRYEIEALATDASGRQSLTRSYVLVE